MGLKRFHRPHINIELVSKVPEVPIRFPLPHCYIMASKRKQSVKREKFLKNGWEEKKKLEAHVRQCSNALQCYSGH